MMSEEEAGEGQPRLGGSIWILLAVATGWLFVLGGRFIIPAVLPQIKATFELGNTGGGIAVTVIWATYALSQTPAGVLTDRLGERRLLIGSLLLTGLSLIGLSFSPTFLIFLLGCGMFGLVSGLYGPARGTFLSRTFPADDGAAIGLTLAAGSLGSAIMPFLAGGFVEIVGWRLIVIGLAVPVILTSGLVWRSLPARPHASTRGGASVSMSAIVRAIRVRGVLIAVSAVTIMLFVFQGLSTFYVTYLVSIKGLDQRIAAGLFALLFVGAAVSQIGGGALADRIGDRAVLTATAILGSVTLAAIPFLDGLFPLSIISLLLGTRLAVAPVSNAYVIDVLPEAVTGTVWGAIRTVFFLVAATGSTAVGAMADAKLFDEALFVLAALTGLAAVFYAVLPTREETRR